MKDLKLSQLLLCVFLIGEGLVHVLGLQFNGLPMVMGVLALAAGVLPLIGK